MRRIVAIILAAAMFAAAPVLAEEARIGYVDLQRALNESAAGQAAKDKIAAKVKGYEEIIGGRQEELKTLKEELEKKAMLLAEEARAAKERDYQQKVKEFQRFTKDAQEELRQQDADYTREILDVLLKTVQEIGKKEGYTLVLEKTESSILFAAEEIDLTDEVIKAYNAGYVEEGAE